jgi:hypothetical protein
MYNPSDDYYLTIDRVIRYLDSISIYILEFRNIPETIIYIFKGSSDIFFISLKKQKNSEEYYF